MNIPALLFPDLALIVLGWLLYRHARLGGEFWAGAEKLVYFVLFPALLFGAIVRNPLSPGESLPMLGTALAALAAGIALGYAARPVLRPVDLLFASGVQCAFRFNSYITLALALRIGGSEGLSLCALIVGFTVPVCNLGAVYALARHSGAGLWKELARNPLVIATLSALAAKAVGLRLPEPIDATLLRMGQAALGLGLICVGAGLRLGRPGASGTPAAAASTAGAAAPAAQEAAATREAPAPTGDAARASSVLRLTLWFTATKLLAMPLTGLLLAHALALPPLATTIVVMYCAMPTAPASYVLASRMGGDGPFVAWLITVSLLASLAALPFWLSMI